MSGSDGKVLFFDAEVGDVSSVANTVVVVGDLFVADRIFPPIRVNDPGGNDDGMDVV
jgi:hypothetical protein